MRYATLLFLLTALCSSALAQPQLTLQLSHPVRSVAVSKDAKLLVSSGNNTIKIWELSSRRLLRTLAGHKDKVVSVALSPDGKTLASGGWDNQVMLWEIATGKLLRTFSGHTDAVYSVAFFPDGRIASAGKDGTVRIWSTSQGQAVQVLQVGSPLFAVAVSPAGDNIAAGAADYAIYLWDAAGGTPKVLKKHLGVVTSVSFSPDGKRLASGSKDLTVGIWEVATGLSLPSLEEHKKTIYSVAFSPDGKYVASGGGDPDGQDCELKIWDAAKGFEPIMSLKGPEAQVSSVCFSADSKTVYAGSFDNTVHGYSLPDGKPLLLLNGLSNAVYAVRYSRDGHLFATLESERVIIRSNDNGKQIRKIVIPGQCLDISPDGKQVAIGAFDNAIHLYDIATGKALTKLIGHEDEVLALRYAPNGTLYSASADGTLRAWDAGASKELRKLSVERGGINDLAINMDGALLAGAAQDKNVYLWEVASGKLVHTLSGHMGAARAVAFSADGKYLASGADDKTVRVWDATQGTLLNTLKGHLDPVTTVSFSPSGNTVASACGDLKSYGDQTLRVWDASTGKLLQTLVGHLDRVYSLDFSRDGKWLASGSEDTQARFWELSTGKSPLTLISYRRSNDYILYATDGRFYGTQASLGKLYYVQASQILPLESFLDKYLTPGLWERIFNPEAFVKEVTPSPTVPVVVQQDVKPVQVTIAQVTNTQPTQPLTTLPTDVKTILPPPVVVISNPQNGAAYQDQGEIKVNVDVTDQGGGVNEIRLYLNDKLVGEGARGMQPVQVIGKVNSSVFTVNLANGLNVLKATALDNNRTESVPVVSYVQFIAPRPEVNLYIIAVGINGYKNPEYKLNYARPDAESVAASFSKAGDAVFTNVYKTELYDADATIEKVTAAFQQVGQKSKPDDVVVFFYAGHGLMLDPSTALPNGEFFLALYDMTDASNEQLIINRALAARRLRELSLPMQAQKQLILLDACQSGGAVKEYSDEKSAGQEKAVTQLAHTAGLVLMASTGQTQYAYEFSTLHHGVFTYTLLEALAGAVAKGSQGEEDITVAELRTYLEDKVPQYTQQYCGKQQFPNAYSRGQDFTVAAVEK